jgi:hypothetical protein
MQISLEQAADVLGKTTDEVLFIVQDGRLSAVPVPDPEISYNEDGTIKFAEESGEPMWSFDFEDVLAVKKELDEGLDGTLREILES